MTGVLNCSALIAMIRCYLTIFVVYKFFIIEGTEQSTYLNIHLNTAPNYSLTVYHCSGISNYFLPLCEEYHSEYFKAFRLPNRQQPRRIYITHYQLSYLYSKVNEATYIERVLHEVKDELDVLDQWEVIGHP